MELYSNFWHIVSAFLIFCLGAPISLKVGLQFSTKPVRSLALYAWHTLFCMVYLWYALNFGGDALGYFMRAENYTLEFEVGTAAVDYLTAVIVQGLSLSLLGTFLVFNIFGMVGLLAFDACLRLATENKQQRIKQLATLIVFLPSVSFWSSAIGKDALSFMATGLALWAALNLGRRAILMAISVAIMLMVRPHIAGMMVLALSLSAVLDPRANMRRKLMLGGISAAVGSALVPFALSYAGLGDSADSKSISDYMEERQAHNMEGGGGVDIANMSLPMKLFTYMFRPMFYEINSVFSLAAAIDNLIMLYLAIMGGAMMWRKARSGLGENRLFMWTYSMLAWFVLAMTTANLGIALRQKWMFTPMVIFLFISVIGRNAPARPINAFEKRQKA